MRQPVEVLDRTGCPRGLARLVDLPDDRPGVARDRVGLGSPTAQTMEKSVAETSGLAAAASAMPAGDGTTALPDLLTIAATPFSRLGLRARRSTRRSRSSPVCSRCPPRRPAFPVPAMPPVGKRQGGLRGKGRPYARSGRVQEVGEDDRSYPTSHRGRRRRSDVAAASPSGSGDWIAAAFQYVILPW